MPPTVLLIGMSELLPVCYLTPPARSAARMSTRVAATNSLTPTCSRGLRPMYVAGPEVQGRHAGVGVRVAYQIVQRTVWC
jgi:hypothetical protein